MANEASNTKDTQPAKRHKNPKLLAFLLLTLGVLSLGFLGGWLGAQSRGQQMANQSNEASRQIISSESQVISEIAKNVAPSVVSVNVTSRETGRSIFGFGQAFEQASAGTGVIISGDGVVITNRHVVPEDATSVSITLSDGTDLDEVEVIGRTGDGDSLDIAFLKITDAQGKQLAPARLGDSSAMVVGDKVVAIGNALGQFQNTVTTGIISGYGRSITAATDEGTAETLLNLFQTDAAINQGNSGGPLVNINGDVIGINTAVAGRAENIGFAIPINDIKGLITGVLETGELRRPYLGVRYISLTDDYAFEFDLPVKRGAYIVPAEQSARPSVLADSPADKAGLKPGDIITKVDDTSINEDNSLTSILGSYQVGDSVQLTYVRGDDEQAATVKLEAAPQR
jgi:serine protease Do